MVLQNKLMVLQSLFFLVFTCMFFSQSTIFSQNGLGVVMYCKTKKVLKDLFACLLS